MNSAEMARVLTLILANAAENTPRLRAEVFGYMQAHEDSVVDQLRSKGSAAIQTSFGIFELKLSDILEAVA